LHDLTGNILPSGDPDQDKVVTMLSARNDDRVPFRRNRILAMALFSVVTSIFAMVVTLVVLFHYAETHHLLASL
jgi:hypothetical protein